MKYILLLLVFFVSFAKAQDYRTDVVVLDSVSKITTYFGGSKLIYVKDTAVGGYFYLYQGSVAADGKDIITGANSSKWRRVSGANVDYTVLQLPSYQALRSLSRMGANKTYIVYYNGVNNYFRYDASDLTSVDDSAMTIVGVGGVRYKRIVDNNTLDVRWFGAIAGDNDDDWYSIQKCFDYAVYNNYKKVSFPGGEFLVSKGLLVYKDVNNDKDAEFINISIEGYTKAYSKTTQNETEIRSTSRNTFVLGIQRGKGVSVKNLNIVGTNQLNYSNAVAWNRNSTYVLDSQRVDSKSPYAGIVLDPFGLDTTSSSRYPGYESYYRSLGNGGSTDCKFENIVVDGFVAGVILTPNDQLRNNEAHVFDGIWFSNCRDGFVTTNSQERQVYVKNFRAWGTVQTIFKTYGYGLGRGEPPMIDGGNIAGNIYQIFDFTGSGGFFPAVSIKNIYAESFYRIGYISAPNVGFKDCHFAFALTTDPSVVSGYKVQNWLYKGSSTTFDNCMLLFYNGGNAVPMNFVGKYFKFTNCYLGSPVGVPFNTWTTNNPEISYTNCRFYSRAGYITDGDIWSESNSYKFYTGNDARYVDLGQTNVTYTYGERYGAYTAYASQYRRVTSRMKKWISLGSVSVTVTADSASATIASLAGKTQFQNFLVFDLFEGDSSGQQVMRIKSIDGSGNVKFDHVVDRFTTGTKTLYIEDYQTLNQPVLFDASSTSLTNVIQESSTTGSTLSTSGIYYYKDQFVTVVSSGAGTATLSGNLFNSTVKRGILSNYDYEEFGYTLGDPLTNSWFNNGTLFTEGSFYKNTKTTAADSLILGYACKKSGIKGSSQAPEFETVYRSKLLGSGYKIANDYTNQFKSLTAGYGLTIDSATAGQINYKVDTTTLYSAIATKFLYEGTYSPTKYIITNLDSVQFTSCYYQRINNTVYVYGEVYTDPTNSNQDTQVDMSLPVATSITNTYSLSGNGSAYAVGEAMRIYGSTSNNRAILRFKSSDNAGHTFSFAFSYNLKLD